MSGFQHGLLLHPRTQAQIEAFLSNPSHALLLIGPTGSGKPTLAKSIAANLLQIDAAKLPDYPYYSYLQTPEGKRDIPIEAVRELIETLKLKTPGKAAVRRVIIIEDAQRMSMSGQNAILKTLEEPAVDTVFILTVPFAKSVAPTIASRAQAISVVPPSKTATLAYYGDRFNQQDVASYWMLSGGSTGLLDALLKDSAEHPLKSSVSAFKVYLGKDTYGRLIDSDRLARDKIQLAYFLDGGGRVLRSLEQNAVKSGQTKRVKSLGSSRRLITSLQGALQANANPRLVATNLALNLKL